jgi:FkbM family methyltransferase
MSELLASKGRLRRARKLARLLRVGLFRDGLRLGIAATIEHEDVPLGSGYRTVIDVGAHHGQFALFAGRAFPGARIYCIEPHEPSRRQLSHLGSLLITQMCVLPFAAAEHPGAASFHVSRMTDSSSLLPIMPSYVAAFPGTAEVREEVVEARPLDEILREREIAGPTLLKIDVQGTELEVLRGATETLAVVDRIYVECSFIEFYEGQALAGDVISFLSGRFDLEGVFGLVHDRTGRCLQADLLFRRKGIVP